MDIKQIKSYLYNLGGASRGLDNFSEFLSKYDNPHQKLRTIQVLGTNGKGSTTAILQRLLSEKYQSVATFTSPALIDVFDRIQINRTDISTEDFTRIFNLIIDDAKEHHLGFFEILCAIAFIYFAENNVEVAIIEAGLGGESDCTSVIDAEVRLLTNVGFDHTEVLGDTIESILKQKLGACTSGDVLITAITDKELTCIIDEYCKVNNINVIYSKNDFDYNLNLIGNHQKSNAALAYECFKI